MIVDDTCFNSSMYLLACSTAAGRAVSSFNLKQMLTNSEQTLPQKCMQKEINSYTEYNIPEENWISNSF